MPMKDSWKWFKGRVEQLLERPGVFIAKGGTTSPIKLGPSDISKENIIAFYKKYYQNQGADPRSADFSLSMVCNIYFDAKGESTALCDVDNITQFIHSVFLGKIPLPDAGT
jgi:hypothetical protein